MLPDTASTNFQVPTRASMPLPSARSRRRPGYQPLLLLVIAAALGILLDQMIGMRPLLCLAGYVAAITTWLILFRFQFSRLASCCLYVATLSLSAGWHHYWWNVVGTEEIGLYATDEPQPLCIEGFISEEPNWVASPSMTAFDPIPQGETTRLVLSVTRLREGKDWVNVSGQIDCQIQGQLPNVGNGSSVRAFGKLARFRPPTNPGEFDFQHFRRSERKLAQLQVNHPAAFQILKDSPFPLSMLSQLRGALNNSIWKYVGEERAPLASAILLGNREQLDRSERERYLVSGTIHILAISGLHVGILAGAILFLGRLGIVHRKYCLIATIVFVLCYAWLVEFRAPVVRASILITVYCISKWTGRDGLSFNTLGLAALIVLIFNPTQLTSVGAQLSFLAVASLAYFYPCFVKRPITDPLDRLIERTRPWHTRFRKSVVDKCRVAFLVSGVVWLVALPLVAERFHIVAPIALIVNPILIIPLTFGLLCGFGVLVFGGILPPVAAVFGKGCDGSLFLIEQLVSWSEHVPASHFWTSGPGTIAVAIFYGGLMFFVAYPPTRLPGRWAWTALACWLAGSIAIPTMVNRNLRTEQPQLVFTFIDVGHGTSVLLQFPDGKNAIYDCGSFGSSERAARSISSVLWHERISHLDLIIISHTDMDHYNGLPKLLRRFSVGQVVVSPPMTGPDVHPNFLELMNRIKGRRIPVETVWQGHSVDVAPQVYMQVISPPQNGTGGSDNSNSIVLALEFLNRTLLLPGDLDGPGLEALFQTTPRHFDVIMAPHHGSSNSDPEQLIGWCQPGIFVVSGDNDDVSAETVKLLANHQIEMLYTARDGAVRIILDASGISSKTWTRNGWTDSSVHPITSDPKIRF